MLRASARGGARPARLRSGLTLIELVTTLAVLGVAFAMYTGTATSTQKQRARNRETVIAADAAQRVLETMRSESVAQLHALYGRSTEDDPGGPNTAPGAAFDAESLQAADGDADGRVGAVLLPEVEVEPGQWELREDARIPELGLPRDLNGDSRIDSANHADDYIRLPVRVRVDWQGRFGPRSYEITTMFANFKS